MTPEQWKNIKYFNIDEKTPWGEPAWGDSNRMNMAVVMILDRLRLYLGHPIYIHCGTQGKHAENSLHYKGRAIDCSCPTLDVWEFYHMATKYQFEGIGVYECWNHQGLHLDYGRFQSPLIKARVEWWTEQIGTNGDPVYKYHYF